MHAAATGRVSKGGPEGPEGPEGSLPNMLGRRPDGAALGGHGPARPAHACTCIRRLLPHRDHGDDPCEAHCPAKVTSARALAFPVPNRFQPAFSLNHPVNKYLRFSRLHALLPEILSRLCCKCSQAGRGMLLAWLLDVYRSEQRSEYRGIRHLVLRLLAAFPVRERVAIVPKLLEFPILTDLNPLEKLEYVNPFDVLDLPIQGAVNATLIGGASLEIFYRDVSSDRPGVRAWAASTLRTLHNGGFLDPTASQRFGAALWTRVDEHGLPADTDYPKSEFLVLPHPLDVDPAEGFINYVRGTQFPAQQSQTATTIASADEPKVALCRDICWAQNVAWSVDDIRCVVDRLTTWWDTDKEHWHRSQIRDAGDDHSFLSIGRDLGTRLSLLVSTLAEMVIRYSDSINDEPTRCTVVRVATECSKYNLPALRLEIACTYVWGSPRESVLCRVEDAMASSRTEAVIEALQAMAMLSRHLVTEADREDVLRLLHGASQMIRWRRNTALPAVLGTLGNVVNKHPWALRGDVEKGVLAGLWSSCHGDGYLRGERHGQQTEREFPRRVHAARRETGRCQACVHAVRALSSAGRRRSRPDWRLEVCLSIGQGIPGREKRVG